jgi:hypothetical protein
MWVVTLTTWTDEVTESRSDRAQNGRPKSTRDQGEFPLEEPNKVDYVNHYVSD